MIPTFGNQGTWVFNNHKRTEGKALGLHDFITKFPLNKAEPLDILHYL